MKPLPLHRSRSRYGYVLFELILALTIFAIAVLGLAKSLNTSLEVANILNRDNMARIGMRSFLEEIRRKPLAQLSTTFEDTARAITYTSTAKPVSITTTSGGTLADLYDLTITATYTVGAELREESVNVYVYKPAQ